MKRRSWLCRAGLMSAGVTVPLLGAFLGPLAATASASLTLVDGAKRPVTVTVADVAEAWYATSPIDICTTPLGCPPTQVPTSPYPADTLHVGVAGGQETSRTYVLPDLTAMPFGSTILKAAMTLPLATDSQSGTVAANTAKLQACLVSAPFQDGTQGSTQAPPTVDCKTSAKPKYDAKKNLFTVDLSPFFAAWRTGLVNGIALVPDTAGAQPTAAWHVAFNGHKRVNTPHISTTLTYRAPATTPPPTTSGGGPVTPPVASAPPPTTSQPAPTGPLPGAVSSVPAQAPPVVAPQRPTAPVAQAPVALSREFQYPLAFLVPLALLAGAAFFTRLFTRDATPLRSR